MDKKKLKDLKRLTEEFFLHHWNSELLGDYPLWSDVFSDFVMMPNYLKGGVYVFVKGDEITYIGVGASKRWWNLSG